MSVTTDTSLEEEDVDELWDAFERLNLVPPQQRSYGSVGLQPARRNDSTSTSLTSTTYALDLDTDDTYNPYSSSSEFDHDNQQQQQSNYRKSTTVSVGPNGKPLVDFPIPRGPDVEALLGVNVDARVMQDMLLKSAMELRDGTRAGRDLLLAMRLQDVGDPGEEEEDEETRNNTVRLRGV